MRDTVSWRSYIAIQDGYVAEKLSRDLGEYTGGSMLLFACLVIVLGLW